MEEGDELDSVEFDIPGFRWVLEAACNERPFVLEVVEVGGEGCGTLGTVEEGQQILGGEEAISS